MRVLVFAVYIRGFHQAGHANPFTHPVLVRLLSEYLKPFGPNANLRNVSLPWAKIYENIRLPAPGFVLFDLDDLTYEFNFLADICQASGVIGGVQHWERRKIFGWLCRLCRSDGNRTLRYVPLRKKIF